MANRSRTESIDSLEPQKKAEQALQAMLQESRRREAEVSALLEGSRAVLEYREFQDAARSIFDSCKKLVGASSGYIALLSKDGTENEVLFLDSGGLSCTVDPSFPMPIRGLREEAYLSGEAVYHNDFSHSQWTGFLPEGHVKLDNVLFAPLKVGGKVVGLLGIANKPGGFSDRDARMASAFGEFAAVALQNSRTLESLEDSEQRFRSVAHSANDGIITTDSSGNIVYCNRAAEKMFGYSADEIAGKPLTLIMPERFREAHQNGIQRVVSTGESRIVGETVELLGLRNDGSEFPVELSLATWKTKEGSFFTGILRDVTERKQAEEKVKRLTAFPSENPDPVMRVAKDGTLMFANRASQCLLNAWGCKLGGTLPEPTREAVTAAFASGQGTDLEVRCKDRTVAIRLAPIVEGGYVNVYGRDITKRKRAEEKLHWELAVSKALAELSSALIASSSSIDEIASIVLDYAKSLTKSAHGYVSSIDPQTGDAVAHTLSPMMENECRVTAGNRRIVFPLRPDGRYPALWGLALNTRQAFYTNSPATHDTSEGLPEGHIPLRNFLSVPAAVGEELVGQVALANSEHNYSKRELEATKRLTELYAFAVQRKRAEEALRKARDELEIRVKERTADLVSANRKLQREIADRKRAENDLREAHQLLETIFDHTHMMVACLDPQFSFIRVNRAYAQADNREVSFFPGKNHFDLYPHTENEAIFRRVVETGEPHFAFAKPFEYAEHPERGVSYWDWSLVPIKDPQGALAGLVFTLLDVTERRRLEREVLEIGTQEQQRIGQELHDELGQELTGLGYLARSLHQKLRNRALPEAGTAAELAQGIQHALGQVHTIVKGLVPLEIGADALLPALQALAANVEERAGVCCQIVSSRCVPIEDDNTAIQLYRIAQEAVNNAVKHGRPERILIELKAHNRRIMLNVRDDGVGIRPDAENGLGSGLRIMRYRAGILGGSLDIKAGKGGGTLVACTLQQERSRDD